MTGSDGLVCITNTMPDVRPCTVQDEHTADCDGNEYRWVDFYGQWLSTGFMCRGCLPRPAVYGLLCGGCYGRVSHASKEWPDLSVVLWQFDRLVQQDGGTSGHESSVPISATKLAIDEVTSHMKYFTGNVDVWIATEAGAAEAVRFAASVNRALRTFPTEEPAHMVQVLRCPECELRSLLWHPPAMATANVRIECRNPKCSYDVDQDAFESMSERVPNMP